MARLVASALLRSRVVIVVADGHFSHPRVWGPDPFAESTPAGYGSAGALPGMTHTRRTMRREAPHRWEFTARFRRHAFGWRSAPPIQRIKQAVTEINTVARRDAVLAAEGAVAFLERVSPALEQVDSSSGAIGAAVDRAIAALVPIVAAAPADPTTRAAWLERLFEAHAADEIPYIEPLADHWGELCASKEVASAWADGRELGFA